MSIEASAYENQTKFQCTEKRKYESKSIFGIEVNEFHRTEKVFVNETKTGKILEQRGLLQSAYK